MSAPALQKILYVEDDEDIQLVARIALEDVGGFEVKICSSGEDALEAVDEFSPDLMLLDVMMPHMDGPETLRRLRAKDRGLYDVPAVFMTAKVMSSDVETYKALGCVEVIPKPFDPMVLADQIKKIWEVAHGG